jgi:hypothetical protein
VLQVTVVETSMDLIDDIRLMRHLALRFGDDDSFVEAHYGPGAAGEGRQGFLDVGKGKVGVCLLPMPETPPYR